MAQRAATAVHVATGFAQRLLAKIEAERILTVMFVDIDLPIYSSLYNTSHYYNEEYID